MSAWFEVANAKNWLWGWGTLPDDTDAIWDFLRTCRRQILVNPGSELGTVIALPVHNNVA